LSEENTSATDQAALMEKLQTEVNIFNPVPFLKAIKKKRKLQNFCKMTEECEGDGYIYYDKGDGVCGECRKYYRKEMALLVKNADKKPVQQAQLYSSLVFQAKQALKRREEAMSSIMARSQLQVNEITQILNNRTYTENDVRNVINQTFQTLNNGIEAPAKRRALPAPKGDQQSSSSSKSSDPDKDKGKGKGKDN